MSKNQWFFGFLALVLFAGSTVLILNTVFGTTHDNSTHVHAASPSSNVDPKNLPLGDGKVSKTPQKGYIYACQTNFNGKGAQVNGPWIHGTTWDSTAKTEVDGQVSWANATFQIKLQGNTRSLTGNNLPPHTTGVYPISASDDAYQYDRNPNQIKQNNISYNLPANPTESSKANCLTGIVGVATTGVPIFDGFDALGRDAAAHEVQDSCGGHPEITGSYHYHSASPCMANNGLVGYAFDGFGIFGMVENGIELTNQDLDECHGHKHTITWDGKQVEMYHYHMTREFPYSLGCFKGTSVVREGGIQGGGNSGGNNPGGNTGGGNQGAPVGNPSRPGRPPNR